MLPGHIAVQHGVVLEVIHGLHLRAVELNHIVALQILVDAVVVVHGPRLRRRCAQQVGAEGHNGLVVAQHVHQCGGDVGLLRYFGGVHFGLQAAVGGVEYDGNRIQAQVGLVFGPLRLVGVVGHNHEYGVAEPWFVAGSLEESAQGMVGVSDALVNLEPALFGVLCGQGLGHAVGVVRRCAEHRGHKRLMEFSHLVERELQERFVPNGPLAVEVVHAAVFWRAAILVEAKIILVANGVGKSAEAHGYVVPAVEKCAVVALGRKH